MRLAERVRPLAERPRHLIAAAVVVQWLSTLAVALQAEHGGWRFGEPERATEILGGTTPAPIVLLNVLVLGPIAVVGAYRIAARVGGLALGAWTLLVWIAAPWLMHVLTLASYDSTLSDRVLPLGLGLTPEPGYAAGVALLGAAALLTSPGARAALLAGLAAGLAVVLTPPAIVFAAPAAAALLAARRPRELGLFVAALAPAILVAAVLRSYAFDELSLDQLRGHIAGLREYFWSQRLFQWLPLAGVVGVARRSGPLAILLGGWFGLYLALQATRAGTSFENGELFRVLLPALPAYVLLAAALPLLVPTLVTRLGPLARPVEAP